MHDGSLPLVRWYAPYAIHPPRHGGQIRVSNLIDGLLRAGVEVELVHPGEPGVDRPGLVHRAYEPRSRSTPWGKVRCALSREPDYSWAALPVAGTLSPLGSRRPDAIVMSQPHLWPLVEADVSSGVPLVLEAQNVEADLYEQLARIARRRRHRTRMRWETAKARRQEAVVLRASTTVVAVSEADARVFREVASNPVEVVQNGVDPEYFAQQDHSDVSRARLVMTGTLGYAPNVDAAEWLVGEILPQVRSVVPQATVTLVGGSPAASVLGLHDPESGVRVVSDVPDVRDYTRASDIFVVPLRVGGGTPLKVAEALASGIPTICTSRVAAAVQIDESCVMIADTASDFARCVERLVEDRRLRDRLVRNGRHAVETRFDWRVLSAHFAEIVLKAAGV